MDSKQLISPESTPASTPPTAKDRLREALTEFGGLSFDVERMQARQNQLRQVIADLTVQVQKGG